MGKYLYCIIKEKEKITFGTSNIGNLNAPVHTINLNNLSAVVSEAPIIDYDPTRKNIVAHQTVITRIMEKYAVIPVAFGTVANNKEEIITILNSNYSTFVSNLEYLKDKVELGLKITWDNSKFNNDIEDEGIKILKNKLMDKKENEILSEKIILGQMVEVAVKNKRSEYENAIYLPLTKISVDSKLKENVPIKTILNSYFLVKKSQEANFDKKVSELSNKFQDRLIFSYTGPWPPYNFINMSLNLRNDFQSKSEGI